MRNSEYKSIGHKGTGYKVHRTLYPIPYIPYPQYTPFGVLPQGIG